MGSPLVQGFKFIFLWVQEFLSNYDGVPPSYYTQYVDIFLVFNSHDEAKQFFPSRHPNVKVTMETEVNKVISFLDVLIENHNNIFNTTTYHKLT